MATHSSHAKIFPQLKSYARLNSLTDRVDVAFYDVKFFPFSEPEVDPIFAVVGGPEAIVCRPLPGENGGVEVIAWFHDEEPDASLNSVTWSQDHETGDPLLIASGTSPIIKIFNVKKNALVRTLVGHGKGINDLAVSPISPQILASASMDKSVRFWSLAPDHEKQPTVLICGGEGHKESILTFAFHPTGRFLLTGGMDHMINLWLLPTLPDANTGTDRPTQIRYPHFTSSAIHTDYVDCVAWYGDLILSKCARENRVVLWRIEGFSSTDPLPDEFFAPTTHEFRPTRSAWNGSFQRLLEFSNPDCDLFFIRFTLYTGPPYAKQRHQEYMSPYAPSPATNGAIPARERPILAVGNEKSKISFWDLSAIETWSGEPDDEPWTKTGKKRGRPSKHTGGTPTSMLAARNRRKEEARGLKAAANDTASNGSAYAAPHPLSASHAVALESDEHNTPLGTGSASPAYSSYTSTHQPSANPSASIVTFGAGHGPGASTSATSSASSTPAPTAPASDSHSASASASASPAPSPSPSTARAALKYGRADPFKPLTAHRSIPIPKTTFAVRAIAWSNDGTYAVGVGDQGVVALFAR